MSKKRKLFIGVLLFALLLFAAGQIAMSGIEKNFEALKENPAKDVDLDTVEDGSYLGRYEVFPVAVEVSVEVKGHRITDIEILKHQNGQGAAAESMVATILEEQSIVVDYVTGATYSSMVIQKALEDALQ